MLEYKNALLGTVGLICQETTSDIAEDAARLRASYNLSTPDAIQLATAIKSDAKAFLTNDSFLISVPDIDILVLDQVIQQ